MHHDESESIREEMARVRGELTTGVGQVVQQAKDLTDWRTIVGRYPWWCVGAAAAVGFMLVPAKTQPPRIQRRAPSADSSEPQNSTADKTFQATMPRRQSSGLLGTVLGLAAKTVVRSAVNLAMTQIEQALASSVRQPPPAQGEHPVQERAR